MIDWGKIDARNFEKFVYYSLGFEGFRNLQWMGKGGGDAGRDIVATTYEELPFNLGYERDWIFQCKKWKRMPSQNVIFNEISKAAQHHPDFWVLVIPVDPTAGMIDFFKRIEINYNFKTILFPLSSIESIVYKYPDLKHVLENGNLPDRGDEYA
ncbi:hypothetical protein BEP19_04800 [Ammoniphilus oxalaticus]|uniref:Restriction endonuclease type IV Mrr domain-containing protein n=1 Tax=Ammoniphilus oxalaticus TaxID=66863 RepID=A0A419SM48_9BACL|nr:restriction endonuclease [Ammoniphilus oxalaticus]RKD25138.1 hypothetical protein BEP19_04800 [Ammoniphilus oxalaticus]